jgi:bifunctional non-homologous end joining protein LigD
MLASVGAELPRGAGWVFEPKYDGIRVLALADRGDVALVSRNGIDKTHSFPEIAEDVLALHKKARKPFVLDGEIVVMSNGTPLRFQELQSRMHVADRDAVDAHRESKPTALIAFDMLVDGTSSLVTEPWRVRRKHLAALLQPPGRRFGALRLSDVHDDGQAMLRDARTHAWEGVIAKRADSAYEVGQRSRAWLKLKIEHEQEFVVGGWTEPRRTRQHFGALLLGYYDTDGGLIYAGHTGTGFTRKSLSEMSKRLTRLERKSSAFTTTPKTNEPAHWAKPEIVVQVKFNEWTSDGKLRHPVFLGVRDDKKPTDVVREEEGFLSRDRARAKPDAKIASASARTTTKPPGTRGAAKTAKVVATKSSPKRARTSAVVGKKYADVIAQLDAIERDGGDGTIEFEANTLEVTSLNKQFFPASKHTKGDLMRYYARIAPLILPTIIDRPLVLKRFPNGVRGQAFYQQKAPAHVPSSVRVETVADEGLETATRIIGGNLQTLLYLIQLGAISVDPWHSRVGAIQDADYSIVDLDPGPRATFARVVEVACAVKDVLDEMKLHAVPKTSGASGIHIVLPLRAHVPNDSARMLAEIIATKTVERLPKIATIERAVKARPANSVYVDFLQNIRGKTVAGVYSVRARPTPSVSTPLRWSEVNEDLDPKSFTVDTVPARLVELGDLWAMGMKKPNSLEGLVGDA